ncbi:HID1 domain-containing protein [Acrasis kona]|uniref:HID1 domain-containing protein n=1 Tax=Acrasis kona TaxID=1008807 RepID=A0AAW2YQA8_9EUKA
MSEYTSAKNSLHLLARILPFVFEHNEDRFVDLLFFDNLVPTRIPAHLLQELKQIDAKHNQDVKNAAPQQQPTSNEPLIAEGEQVPQTPTTPFVKNVKEGRENFSQQPVPVPKQPTPTENVKAVEDVNKGKEAAADTPPQSEPVVQHSVTHAPAVATTTATPVNESSNKKKNKKNKKKQQQASAEVKTEEPVAPAAVQEEKVTPAAVEADLPALDTLSENKAEQEPVKEEEPQQVTEPVQAAEASAPQPQEPSPPVKQEEPAVATTTPEVAPQPTAAPITFDQYKQSLRKITHLADEILQTPLAHAMVSTFMKVLFVPGFSIPTQQTSKEINSSDLDINYLWDKGLGDVNAKYPPSYDQLDNRHDTLKCLISTFSGVLYLHSDECNSVENKFLTIATLPEMPNTKTLLYSLLNMVMNYDPRGYMPYTTQVFSNYSEKYIEMALHMVSILLHHKPSSGVNVYVKHIREINNESELNALYSGITLNLQNLVASNNTYLPNSQRQISFYEELLVLTWKILVENVAFRIYICKEQDVSLLLLPLLFVIQSHATEPSKFPVVQMASFMLLLLSGHREFGVSLNKPFLQKVPLDLPVFSGNYADLLIILLHKVIVSDKGTIRPLYDCLLTIVANISPYTKSLSLVTSVKLLSLFEAFSSTRFLYASDKNHQYVQLLLEVFNNLIQYQYEGNTHLVYAILRRRKAFKELEKDHDLQEVNAGLAKRRVPNTFVPDAEWVKTWKPFLPLQVVKALFDVLTPEVEKLCSREMATSEDVLDYLRKSTLVGLLPVPHTIIIRTFQNNPRIDVFLTTYLWGLIYLKSLVPPCFDANTIKLFQVNVIE